MRKALIAIAILIVGVGVIVGVVKNRDDDKKTESAQTVAKKTYPGQTITGAGSSFAAPLYGQLGSEFKSDTQATINYQSVGSGAGIAQFTEKTVNYGATDVALKDADIAKANADTPLNIPVAFGSVTVSYNIPGVEKGLKLDGPTLANIYLGKITKWNDAAIAGLNSGVNLPDLAITPVYRSEASGTTSQFTEFLKATSPDWAPIGSDKTVKWPTGTGAKGNDGVAAATSQTKGAIGYVELAYALQNNFTTSAVKNKAGDFVAPSLDSTSKAGDNLPNLPEDLRFSAINSPNKGAYPIASATFIVVYKDACKAGSVKDLAQAQALSGWFSYLLGGGQTSMEKLQYAKLPDSLKTKAQAMVDGMTCNGTSLKSS